MTDGSNVDLGDFAELDREIRSRQAQHEKALAEVRKSSAELVRAEAAYLKAYAREVTAAAEDLPTAAKERLAKTRCVELRCRYLRAQVWDRVTQLALRASENQLSALQTRSSNLRSQMRGDT